MICHRASAPRGYHGSAGLVQLMALGAELVAPRPEAPCQAVQAVLVGDADGAEHLICDLGDLAGRLADEGRSAADGDGGALDRDRGFATCRLSPRATAEGRQVRPGYAKRETSTAFSVMNSRRAGVPSRVFSMPRRIAGTICSGSLTRSP